MIVAEPQERGGGVGAHFGAGGGPDGGGHRQQVVVLETRGIAVAVEIGAERLQRVPQLGDVAGGGAVEAQDIAADRSLGLKLLSRELHLFQTNQSSEISQVD